jgi:dTDP-4-amino-4,6-dideoxygalactose transaminase
VDLVAPHQELEEELVSVFKTALKTAGFIGGPLVEAFEREFAEFCGVRRCVGVGSGTDALRLALIASGVQPGETVVTVPNTFIATTEAISQAGGRLDFVDIDERRYTMDPDKLRSYLETECTRDLQTGRAVSKRTGSPVTAVIPVHLYGQMADMDPILDLATQYHLMIVEDACQAHGAEYFSSKKNRRRKAGSMGRAAVFSFYPGKNLGACGEAGAITTDDEQVARRCQLLRDHGQSRKYFHDFEGYNGRLDAIQAGILSAKLKRLPAWNAQRREAARRYQDLLTPLHESINISAEPPWAYAVYHLFVIRVQERDALKTHLAHFGIGTGIHYPIPLHLQEAYRHLGFQKEDFPVSEAVADQLLSLPMYPELDIDTQREIVDKIREFLLNRPAYRASHATELAQVTNRQNAELI